MGRKRTVRTSAFSLFSFQDIITSVTGIMLLTTLLLAVELIHRTRLAPPAQTQQQLEDIQRINSRLAAEISELKARLAAASAEIENIPLLDQENLERLLAASKAQKERARRHVHSAKERLAGTRASLSSASATESQVRPTQESALQAIHEEIKQANASLKSIKSADRMIFKSGIKDKETWIVEVTESSLRAAKIGERSPPQTFAADQAFFSWLNARQRSKEALYLVVKPPNASDRFRTLRDRALAVGLDIGYTLVDGRQQILDPQVGAGLP